LESLNTINIDSIDRKQLTTQSIKENTMRTTLTPDDLKQGDLVEPGWHPAEIIDYKEKPADTDNSTNCIFHFKILDGSGKGVKCQKLFNEKALGFGKSLWSTLKLPYDAVKGYDLSTQLFEQTVGHKMMIYIKRGKSNKGNEFNDVQDFKPLSSQ
jgi:Protein of unknown function (DUF669)